MKLLVALLLPLLVKPAAIEDNKALERRQIGTLLGLLGDFLIQGPKKPISTKRLPTVSGWSDPAAVREVVQWGPFQLKPVNTTRDDGFPRLDQNSDVFNSMLTGLCSDCTILSADAGMVFKDGERANIDKGVYGHHIIVADLGRSQVNTPVKNPCNGSFGGLAGLGVVSGLGAIAGSAGLPTTSQSTGHSHGGMKRQLIPGVSVLIGKGGEDSRAMFAAPNSSFKSGFHVQKNDQIILSAEQVNYASVPQDIYFQLDYEYVPGRPAGLLDVGFGAIDVQGCGNLILPSPPLDRPYTYASQQWNVTSNGYLLGFSPHLHDGASNVKFYRNNDLVCTSNVAYTTAGEGAKIDGQEWETIKEFSVCPDPVRIKVGDTVSMTSDYDLTKYKLRPNAMHHEISHEIMALMTYTFAKEV